MKRKLLLTSVIGFIVLVLSFIALESRALSVKAQVSFEGSVRPIGIGLKGDSITEIREPGVIYLSSSKKGANSVVVYERQDAGDWKAIDQCLYLQKPLHKHVEADIVVTNKKESPLRCRTLNYGL